MLASVHVSEELSGLGHWGVKTHIRIGLYYSFGMVPRMDKKMQFTEYEHSFLSFL